LCVEVPAVTIDIESMEVGFGDPARLEIQNGREV